MLLFKKRKKNNSRGKISKVKGKGEWGNWHYDGKSKQILSV